MDRLALISRLLAGAAALTVTVAMLVGLQSHAVRAYPAVIAATAANQAEGPCAIL